MIEIQEKNVTKTEMLYSLSQGTVFRFDGDYFIKSDEVDEYGDPRCVRLRDGLIICPDDNTSVSVAQSVKMEVSL